LTVAWTGGRLPDTIAPFALAPAAVGELAFVAWLLVKAVNAPRRDEHAPAAATV
jgi:hypothetical protein